VVAAIINADIIINNALIPKNPNSNTVIGRFAQVMLIEMQLQMRYLHLFYKAL
jgi:hypothetical protein